MKIAIIPMFIILFAGMAFLFLPTTRIAFATSTSTIVGWLVPDGSHWNNGIVALIFPLVGAALFGVMGRVLDMEENQATFALIGLTIGAVLGMLALGNSTAGNAIPFALPVVAGFDLFLWLWKGRG